MSYFDSVCDGVATQAGIYWPKGEFCITHAEVGGRGGGGGERRSEIINTEDTEISWQHAFFFFYQGGFGKTGCGFLNFSLFSWRGVTITELAYVS